MYAQKGTHECGLNKKKCLVSTTTLIIAIYIYAEFVAKLHSLKYEMTMNDRQLHCFACSLLLKKTSIKILEEKKILKWNILIQFWSKKNVLTKRYNFFGEITRNDYLSPKYCQYYVYYYECITTLNHSIYWKYFRLRCMQLQNRRQYHLVWGLRYWPEMIKRFRINKIKNKKIFTENYDQFFC